MRKLCHKKTFFICLSLLFCSLFCLSFSSPASAVEITINSSPTGYKFLDTSFYCAYSRGQWTYSAGQACMLYGGAGLPSRSPIFGLKTASNVSVKEGYYYRFTVNVQSSAPDAVMEAILWYPTTSSDFSFISFGQISDEMVFQNYIDDNTSGAYSKNYEVTLRANITGEVPIQFGNGTNTLFWYPVNEVAPNQTSFIAFGEISEYEAADFSEALENEREEEKQEIQDAADDAQDSADEYGDQASEQGQSLLSTVSSFVTGLTQVQPSNCVIDVDLSLYRGGSHNSVDLCPTPKNSYVNTILVTVSGIIMAVWVVRAVITVIQTMISMYREYQS